MRHLVERNASGALAEMEAAIEGGVEVGQLLDQLVGYFRDVMTAAVGCTAEQMLYALPSQAEEIAETGRRLGLTTILAIEQILDHTAARMRVSMHGRTLVEMAVVRICNLENLDELAALVAELRGEAENAAPGQSPPAELRQPKSALPPTPPIKKNDESLASARLGRIATLPTSAGGAAASEASEDAAHKCESAEVAAPVVGAASSESRPQESVLSRFQQALTAVEDRDNGDTAVRPPRASRREQLAEVAERPLVRRAMELFDVPPGQFRYTPAESDSG